MTALRAIIAESRHLAIGDIATFSRMRQADRKHVETLADSIREVGLLNPITVAPSSEGGFALVAGMHRLEACRLLGWDQISVTVVNLDEQRRVIAECDENLCAPSLTAAEKAFFTARRKEAYEALHPETAHGANQYTRSGQVGHSNEIKRFTAETASRTGQSERVVRRDAERGERIAPEALDELRGTKLDKGTYLDSIKNLPGEQQVAKVKVDLEAQAVEPTPVEPAEPVDPAIAKQRRELAKLTPAALVDEVIGLRAENAELRSKIKALKSEIEMQKEDLAAYRQDDMGRALGNAQRQARAAEGRMKEYQATAVRADRRAKILEAENARLKAELEKQELDL